MFTSFFIQIKSRKTESIKETASRLAMSSEVASGPTPDELLGIIEAYYEAAEDLKQTDKIAGWVKEQGYCVLCMRAIQRCACNKSRSLTIHMAPMNGKLKVGDLVGIIGALDRLLGGDSASKQVIYNSLRANGYCQACMRGLKQCVCLPAEE